MFSDLFLWVVTDNNYDLLNTQNKLFTLQTVRTKIWSIHDFIGPLIFLAQYI